MKWRFNWQLLLLIILLLGLGAVAYKTNERMESGKVECKPYCTVAFV